VFSTGPVTSQAAPTRPPQPPAHRIRRTTSPTVILLGLVFLTVGGQMVSATENALINTVETPFAVA
jgi:hypothetical protein